LAAIAINNAKTYSAVSQTARELQRHEEQKTEQLIATRAELLKKNVQLQNLWKRLVQVQEDERTRIAHDLHDSTTQLIFGAIYATQAAIEQLQTEPVVASKSLETVVLLLNQIAGEIRDSISDLHPVILDKEGISTALRNYVQHISITTGIECVFESDGSPIRLPKTTELAIYRITQEALQNATLHANPTKICVKILYLGESIRLAVEDNGIGFIYPQDLAELEGCVTDSEISTYGVMGMRERAESIGALFEIITEPDVGTSVVLTIPL
jgi:signal transduction histidine kinase